MNSGWVFLKCAQAISAYAARAGFSLPALASFFLICAGNIASAGYGLHVMPRPAGSMLGILQ